MKVTLAGNRVTGYEPFVQVMAPGPEAVGSPVDVLVMPDEPCSCPTTCGRHYRISYAR